MSNTKRDNRNALKKCKPAAKKKHQERIKERKKIRRKKKGIEQLGSVSG